MDASVSTTGVSGDRQAANAPRRFLNLPLEIRLTIYKFFLFDADYEPVSILTPPFPPGHFDILYTCRQIHWEATPVFYSGYTWVINIVMTTRRWSPKRLLYKEMQLAFVGDSFDSNQLIHIKKVKIAIRLPRDAPLTHEGADDSSEGTDDPDTAGDSDDVDYFDGDSASSSDVGSLGSSYGAVELYEKRIIRRMRTACRIAVQKLASGQRLSHLEICLQDSDGLVVDNAAAEMYIPGLVAGTPLGLAIREGLTDIVNITNPVCVQDIRVGVWFMV